jgi:superfamily II DNA/RNA helicase
MMNLALRKNEFLVAAGFVARRAGAGRVPCRCRARTASTSSSAPAAPAVAGAFLSDARWREFGLHPLLARTLEERLGLERAAAIQAAAVPVVRGGGDVIIAAETGSGKSLAFCVPVVDRLLRAAEAAAAAEEAAAAAAVAGDAEAELETDPWCEAAAAAVVATPPAAALVLLPTSDLCQQLLAVLEGLCDGEGAAAVQTSVGAEALLPWAQPPPGEDEEPAGPSSPLDMFIRDAWDEPPAPEARPGTEAASAPVPRAVLAVCTPGMFLGWSDEALARLVRTPGLLHVVCLDEVDMLLTGGSERFVRRLVRLSRPRKRRDARQGGGGARASAAADAWQPQLIVAGATMPDSGLRSVWAELQKLLPAASVARSHATALHRHNPLLDQSFVSVPAAGGGGGGGEWAGALCELRVAELLRLLRGEGGGEGGAPADVRTMVFCNTVRSAAALCERLEQESAEGALPHTVLPFHKKVSPALRRANLLAFERAEAPTLLVCTDLASRGLDVPCVQHVVQFEFATNVVAHLHRIGRTARAGQPGRATNFVDPDAEELVESIRSAGADTLASSFSRRRGFRKRVRKQQHAEEAPARDDGCYDDDW